MIVSCLPPPVGELSAELDIKTHSHLRPEPEPDTWPSTVQDHRRGVTLPRQTDRYCNEKLRKYRDGTPDRLRDGTLHPSLAAPRRAPRGR